MRFSPFILALALASCSINPTLHMADGSWVNLGAGVLENSTAEGAKYTGPNGVSLVYSKTGKNQTTGAGLIVTGAVGLGLGKQATAVAQSNNVAALGKLRSNNAAAVDQALIKNPVKPTILPPDGSTAVFAPAPALIKP